MRSVIHLSLVNIVMSIINLNRNGGGDCNNDLFTPDLLPHEQDL